jgi:hypothetical protein
MPQLWSAAKADSIFFGSFKNGAASLEVESGALGQKVRTCSRIRSGFSAEDSPTTDEAAFGDGIPRDMPLELFRTSNPPHIPSSRTMAARVLLQRVRTPLGLFYR